MGAALKILATVSLKVLGVVLCSVGRHEWHSEDPKRYRCCSRCWKYQRARQ